MEVSVDKTECGNAFNFEFDDNNRLGLTWFGNGDLYFFAPNEDIEFEINPEDEYIYDGLKYLFHQIRTLDYLDEYRLGHRLPSEEELKRERDKVARRLSEVTDEDKTIITYESDDEISELSTWEENFFYSMEITDGETIKFKIISPEKTHFDVLRSIRFRMSGAGNSEFTLLMATMYRYINDRYEKTHQMRMGNV